MEKVTSTLLAILIALILLVIGVHFLPFDEAILSSIRSMLTTTSTIVFFLFLLTFIGSSIHDQLISPPERTVLMLEPNHLGDIESTKGAAPIFIKLPIHGIIGGPDLSMDLIDSFLTDTFGPILPKEQIRGVILHIDSPGGTDIDSAGIYKLISELKERFKFRYTPTSKGSAHRAASMSPVLQTALAPLKSVKSALSALSWVPSLISQME